MAASTPPRWRWIETVSAIGSTNQYSATFVGRLHPKKGVDALIDAWRLVQDRFPEWRLVIAGDDVDHWGASGYMDALRRRVETTGAARVSFAGELRGPAKWDAYANAALCVLPSYSESFGMTVAEALAAGTPVVTTRATPGRRGRVWMAAAFSWLEVGRRMARTYGWLRAGGDPPPWVRAD